MHSICCWKCLIFTFLLTRSCSYCCDSRWKKTSTTEKAWVTIKKAKIQINCSWNQYSIKIRSFSYYMQEFMLILANAIHSIKYFVGWKPPNGPISSIPWPSEKHILFLFFCVSSHTVLFTVWMKEKNTLSI